MNVQNEQRTVELVINNKQANVSMAQVRKEIIALTREFSKLKEADNPTLYKQKAAELKKLSQVYGAMRSEIGGAQSAAQKFFAEIKTIAAGVLGGNLLAGFVMELKNLITDSIRKVTDLSDQMANIGKTTNLTNDEIKRLDDLLGQINTRTAKKDLREFAAEAGKLGRNSVEDVKRFVEEADKINVALGEDLGRDAIIEIVKLADIFGEGALDIGSAINSIGQASVATEAFQVDFLKRTAAIGKTVNITAKDLLGYGAALEISGQTAEVSGTALQQFMINFTKNTEDFGGAVGMAKGELTALVRDKGTNAAFLEWLQKFKDTSGSAQEMLNKLEDLKIDGQRGAGVLLALAQNVGLVVEQQKVAAQSAGSILTEFNRKNENEAAKYEKAVKKLDAAMTPLKKTIGGVFIALMYFLSGSIGLLLNFAKVATIATVGIVSYKAAVWLASGGLRALAASIYTSIVPMGIQRAAALASATVMALLKGETVSAAMSFRLLTTAVAANPFGLIAAVIATAVTAFQMFNSQGDKSISVLTDLQQAEIDAAKSYELERVKIEKLIAIASDKTKSDKERATALEQLRNLGPGYLQFLDQENILTDKGRKLIDQYLVSLKNKIIAQSLNKAYTSALEKQIEAERKYAEIKDAIEKEASSKFADRSQEQAKQYIFTRTAMYTAAVDIAKKEVKAVEDYASKMKITLGINESDSDKQEAERLAAEQATEKAKQEAKKTKKHKAQRLKTEKEILDDEFELAMTYQRTYFTTKENMISASYASGLINEQQYQDLLNEIEIERLNDSIRIHKEYNKDYADVVKSRIAIEVKNREESEKKAPFDPVKPKGTYRGGEGGSGEKKKLNPWLVVMDTVAGTDKSGMTKDQKDVAISAASAINDAYEMYHQMELDRIQQRIIASEGEFEKKKQYLKDQLDAGIISQEQYNASLESIEATFNAKQRALKQEDFKKRQQQAIADAIINGALALTKIFANYSPPISYALAAIQGVLTGVQIAKINSTPMPQFYAGGMTVTGASDRKRYYAMRSNSIFSGGRFSGPTFGLIGERGPEFVVPNYIYSNPQNANVMAALEASVAQKKSVLSIGANSDSSANLQQLTVALASLTSMVNKLDERLAYPIEAVAYYDIQKYQEAAKLRDKALELGKF